MAGFPEDRNDVMYYDDADYRTASGKQIRFHGEILINGEIPTSSLDVTNQIESESPPIIRSFLSYANVKDEQFGAVGDGITDDTVAIQAALDTGRPVYLPEGTYILNGSRKGTFSALLTYPTKCLVFGDGDKSVLKVADGYTVGGDYKIFAPLDVTETDDVIFRDFTLDGNGQNNTVLGSTGGNIRRAYMIYVDNGKNPTVDNIKFYNCPGRNVIVFGNNTDHSVVNGRISNNYFNLLGPGIPGNSLQNDHSCIYTQMDGGVVENNYLIGADSPVNPATVKLTSFEIHGSNTTVKNNYAQNFGRAGNLVATVMNSIGNKWIDNTFIDAGGLAFWSFAGFKLSGYEIRGNRIKLDTTQASLVEAGIFVSQNAGLITETIYDTIIVDNVIETDTVSGISSPLHGVFISTAEGMEIRGNTFRNIPGCPIIFDSHATLPLNARNVVIKDNIISNWGFHTVANRVWVVFLLNDSTNTVFENFEVDYNIAYRSLGIGFARGFSINGPGPVRNVVFGEHNNLSNIVNITHLQALVSSTDFERVVYLPKSYSGLTADSPTSGFWLVGDKFNHTNVAASGFLGKVCTTAGAASEAVWAATTPYVTGQWIRTSTSKVLECIVAGTSSGVEPNPATLGETVVDGSVSWSYKNATLAVFKTYGAVSA